MAIEDDGTDLVAPNAHTNPDHLGTRRDEALDISHSVNDMASGEVSQDEIGFPCTINGFADS